MPLASIPKGIRIHAACSWQTTGRKACYPLRRDFPYNYRPPRAENVRPQMREPPAGASVMPMGPFFPVLEEPAYWRMFVEGRDGRGMRYPPLLQPPRN